MTTKAWKLKVVAGLILDVEEIAESERLDTGFTVRVVSEGPWHKWCGLSMNDLHTHIKKDLRRFKQMREYLDARKVELHG